MPDFVADITLNTNRITGLGDATAALHAMNRQSSDARYAGINGPFPSASAAVTQTAHGFVVGDTVYLNGVTYTKAKADSVVTAEVVGVVSSIVDANNFVLTVAGKVTGMTGLTAGTVYFLSDVTAGLLTATAPVTAGNVNKPVLVADTTTSGYILNLRGLVIGPNSSTNITANTQSGTSYTLVLADQGLLVRMTNAAASTLTVPTNASVAFPVGTVLSVYCAGAGGLTITPAGGVTIRNNTSAMVQYGEASLRKDATDEWVRVG